MSPSFVKSHCDSLSILQYLQMNEMLLPRNSQRLFMKILRLLRNQQTAPATKTAISQNAALAMESRVYLNIMRNTVRLWTGRGGKLSALSNTFPNRTVGSRFVSYVPSFLRGENGAKRASMCLRAGASCSLLACSEHVRGMTSSSDSACAPRRVAQ